MKTLRLLSLAACLALPGSAWAAIGCTLSNPAQDLKYLFPDMSSYKEELKEFPRLPDGAQRYAELKTRLDSDLDPIYETFETPYTLYSVFKGKEKIGIVHGVNVPGKGGVIQVFLSTDPKANVIRRFFFQRLESPAARALRDKAFRQQFEGRTLADLGTPKPPAIDARGQADYEATLRGIRKNLILLDLFVYATAGGAK